MRQTDVVIAGGGLAGSLAAAMLGRAGIDAVLIDPHPVYPPDFRCEKLDSVQLQTLNLTGVADAVLRASTPDQEAWVARFGRVVEKLRATQRGILYDTLVNTVRSQIPDRTEFVHAKVTEISDRSRTANRQAVERRRDLRTPRRFGDRTEYRLAPEARHRPRGASVPAIRSRSASTSSRRTDGLSVLFADLLHRAAGGPDGLHHAVSDRRHDARQHVRLPRPARSLAEAVPRRSRSETLYCAVAEACANDGRLHRAGFVQIRPVDLYVTKGYRQNGVVLVGDAFSSSCPAAGTGARKVLVDVERLCNVHIPRWLATPGMGEAKIAAFYDDPVKLACDALPSRRHSGFGPIRSTRAALDCAALGQVLCALGQRPAAASRSQARAGLRAAFATRLHDETPAMGAQHAGAQIARRVSAYF